MKNTFPEPGNGYKIRKLLGGGNWKTAYQASYSFSLRDVALLLFHDNNSAALMSKDITNLMEAARGHEYGEYIAEFKGFFKGDDSRYYLVEELLDRPLDKMTPLNDLDRFYRIARDLTRALCSLHASNLIHRDLKLDNCGIDHQGRAKLFDLGTVTSEFSEIRGTILTRAPELLIGSQERCDKSTDIWALGATLLALKTSQYPFVTQSEIDRRNNINKKLRSGQLEPDRAANLKNELDSLVRDRILEPNAENDLKERVQANFRGSAETLLLEMLSFKRSDRDSAVVYEKQWDSLVRQFGGVINNRPGGDESNKWDIIRQHVELALRGELRLTQKQASTIINEYATDVRRGEPTSDFEALLMDLKDHLSGNESRRSA